MRKAAKNQLAKEAKASAITLVTQQLHTAAMSDLVASKMQEPNQQEHIREIFAELAITNIDRGDDCHFSSHCAGFPGRDWRRKRCSRRSQDADKKKRLLPKKLTGEFPISDLLEERSQFGRDLLNFTQTLDALIQY